MNVNLDNVKPYILSDRVISSDMTFVKSFNLILTKLKGKFTSYPATIICFTTV